VTGFSISGVPRAAAAPPRPGIGVAAGPDNDAPALVAAAFDDVARIVGMTRVRSVHALDQRHVAPDTDNVVARGSRPPIGAA
jgi:hypothetical protein